MAEGLDKVWDILSWKDRFTSIVTFLCFNLIFFLMVFGEYSLLGILAWVALAHLGFIYCHQLLYPQKFPDDDYEYVSKETVETIIANLFALINGVFGRLRKATSTEQFAQALLVLVSLSYISQLFTTEGMLWLLTLLAFGLPVFYEKNQTTVNQQLNLIKDKWQDIKTNTFDKIPRASGCVTEKST